MKSFHLSGPKFDIAVEKFCLVKFSNFLLDQKFVMVEFEFSIRSEIRRGRIRKCEDWSQEGQFCEGRPPLAMPNAKWHQDTSLSHYFEWKYV